MTKSTFSLLLIAVFGQVPGATHADAGVSIGIEAHEMRLIKGTDRVWKFPEGWLCRMLDQGEMQQAEFALPQTLPPGEFTVFVKARNGGADARVSCGGATSAELVFDGAWSQPVVLAAKTPAAAITLTTKNKSATAVNCILQAVYITDRKNVVIGGADCVVVKLQAAPTDPSSPVPGNLVPNSSFETGLGQGWLFAVPGSCFKTPGDRLVDYRTQSIWDAAGGCHGQACLKLPPESRLFSRVFRVRPWRTHSFSCYAKADGAKGQVIIELANVHPGYDNLGPVTKKIRRSFPLTDRWQRLTLSEKLSGFPAPEYQIGILAYSSPSAVQIDALQFEEGEATSYAPLAPLEVGLACDKPGNIFFEEEPIRMELLAFNGSSRPVSGKAGYAVHDYLNRKVKEGTVDIHVPADSRWRGELDLATGKRGPFRMTVWLDGAHGTDEEVAFSVVPRPQREGPDPTSMMGIHAVASDFQYDVLNRLGIKWTRIMSPAIYFRWHAIEPEQGKFTWYDAEIQRTVRHGLGILGTIGTNEWPRWSDRGGKPDLGLWEQSVFEIVEHYRPWVKYWEVWNEPIHHFPPDFYAQMLKAAARAIRKADPEAKIVGMGGSYSYTWCLDVIKSLGGNPHDFMDYLSTHIYSEKTDPMNPLQDGSEPPFYNKIMVPYKLEVWNTETGVWCQGLYQGVNSGFRSAGEPIFPAREGWRYYRGGDYEAAVVARNFLHSIGNGFARYFYYDCRFDDRGVANASHCTIFDVGDTIRAKGIAYAVAGHFFDHAKCLGNASPNANTFAYVFDRDGTALAAVFAASKENMTQRSSLTLELAKGQFKVSDMMGNELPANGSMVVYGRQPVYVEGAEGLSAEVLQAALSRGVVQNVEDKTAPAVSICDAPRGVIAVRSAFFRWIALDDTACPIEGRFGTALEYSYRLVGRDADWSPWTAKICELCEDLAPGEYRFEVKAKDASGNVSEVANRAFTVAESAGSSPKR